MISKIRLLIAPAAALVLLSACSKSPEPIDNSETQAKPRVQPSASPSETKSAQSDGMSKAKLDALLKKQMKPLSSQAERDAQFAEQMTKPVAKADPSLNENR